MSADETPSKEPLWRQLGLIVVVVILLALAMMVRRALAPGPDDGGDDPANPPAAVEPESDGDAEDPNTGAVQPHPQPEPPTPKRPVVGRVIDEEERGVAGAHVWAAPLDVPPFGQATSENMLTYTLPPDYAADVQADDDGRFSLDVDADAQWTIRAKAEDGRVGLVAWRGGDEECFVTLRRRGPLRLRVIDTAEEPVVDAEVLHYDFTSDRPPLGAVRTDESGEASLMLAADDELLVRAPGFATRYLTRPFQRRGAPVILRAAFPLGGVVMDTAGEPVAGAAVSCSRPGTLTVASDAAGRFAWPDLEGTAAEVRIDATAPGYDAASARAYPGATDVRLVLPRPATIAGTATLPDGSPAAAAAVWTGSGKGPRTTADADGRFRLEDVPSGTVKLRVAYKEEINVRGTAVRPASHLATRTVTATTGTDVPHVQMVLEPVPWSFVSLRIADEDGRLLRGVKVSIGGALAYTSRSTGTDGRVDCVVKGTPGSAVSIALYNFRREDLREETRTTVLSVAEPRAIPDDLVIARRDADEVVTLELVAKRTDGQRLTRQADVNWMVTVAGRRGVVPKVFPPRKRGDTWRATVELPPGEPFTVGTSAVECATVITRHAGAPGGPMLLVCELPPQSVVGGRMRTPSGQPVGHAIVEVTVTTPDSEPVKSVAWFDQVFRDGRFFADQLPGGKARLVVRRSVRDIAAEVEIEIPSGAFAQVGLVVVDQLPVLRGSVVSTDDVPLGGATVIVREGASGELVTSTVSQADGSFALATPSREGAVIEVFRPGGYALFVVPLADVLAAGRCDARLAKGGQLAAVLAGPPPPGTWLDDLEVRTADGAVVWLGSFRERSGDWVDGEHRFDLTRLPLGVLRLRLPGVRPDGTPWEATAEVELVAGGSARVELRAAE